MNVTIIKYSTGNIQSIIFSLERIGIKALVTDSYEIIKKSDKIILPGVGEASFAMKNIKKKKLDTILYELKQPVLGICLGMQLLCSFSEESNTKCIGVFDTNVKKFCSNKNIYKIPKVGWNTIHNLKSPLFNQISDACYQYFVHSYYVPIIKKYTIGTTNYIVDYSAALKKKNFYAVQFHPEKSSYVGSKILENFIQL